MTFMEPTCPSEQLQFCNDLGHQPFPVQVTTILRYLAFLSASGRAFGTIQNHISSIKHFHLLLGFAPGWDSAYLFQLALRGSKRLLGTAPFRKLPITPNLLLSMARLFNLGNPLHAAMWALFLVAFFSFLRKSNLVADSPSATSDKLPRRCDFVLAPEGAFLQIRATKTIQFKQRILSIPLPFIPNSPLCPVSALINHFRLNRLASSDFLFSVKSSPSLPPRPITYRNFASFLSKAITTLDLDPQSFSPHSFRRGGASFAFECNVPAELIKFQGDWRSDAYLVYLEMSSSQKRLAVNSMASRIRLPTSSWFGFGRWSFIVNIVLASLIA